MILNLLPITKGGGLQGVMSFLTTLAGDSERRDKVTVICRNGTAAATLARENFPSVSILNGGMSGRIEGEWSALYKHPSAKMSLTFFGSPIFGSKGRFVNVCGCAYPNLFYPEIDFWNYLPVGQRIKKRIIDFIRCKGLKQADFWIFETEIMRNRAVRLFDLPRDRTVVVGLTPSSLVTKAAVNPERASEFDQRLKSGFRFLMLAGAHSNKQQILIPDWIESLLRMGCKKFSFVTTMKEQDPYATKVISEIAKRGYGEHFANVGPVQPQDCASLIDRCDAMLCLSRLESFSNNFVEAWQLEKPLVVSTVDWAQETGGSGALFVEPTSFLDVAATLKSVMEDASVRERLVASGRKMLTHYHTPTSRYNEYWRVLDVARELGPCPPEARKKIRW